MTLAVLIVACLVLTVVSAVAVKGQRVPTSAGVVLAATLPLGAWLFMQFASEPARSPVRFEVLGQYHRLSDTIRLASEADANVVLHSVGAAGSDVDIVFNAATTDLSVQVNRARGPVLLGSRPVNALPLARRSVIRSAAGDSVVIVRPWFCFRCDTRYIETDSVRREARLGVAPRIAVGGDTVQIFRVGGTAWAAADPSAGISVDSAAIPALATGAADSLFIGWPIGERLLISPVPASHRLDIRFSESARSRWVLPRAIGDTLTLLVSATAGESLPGTMQVLNPASMAPGGAREPYGGVLTLRDGAWSYSANGTTRAFNADVPQLLPGATRDRAAGHIVQIRNYDMDPARARLAVVAAWLLGVLTLGLLWRHMHPNAVAGRVALLGAVYTLIAVRGALAFRAWLAPPHDIASPQTFIALLLAVPLLTGVLHLWTRAAESGGDRRFRREIAFTAAPLAGALAVVGLLILPGWRAPVFQTVAAAVLVGAAGLALLNRMLLGRAESAAHRDSAPRPTVGASQTLRARRVHTPLAAASAPAIEGYTYRNFLAALVLLAVLGFLLIVSMQLLRYGTLLALAAWGAIFSAALFAVSDPGLLIRRRSATRPIAAAVLAGVASGAVAYVLRLGFIASGIALVAGAGIAYALVVRSAFGIRPVRLRTLLGAPLVVAVVASLAAVVLPDLIRATRVTAEYALALAGLIAISRIFSILWFRHAHSLTRVSRATRDRRPLPGGATVGAVLVLLIAAVYVPLAVFDPGLVLLFLAATVTAVALGFHTMGARALSLITPAAVLLVFFLGMFVRPSSLEDGSASLGTAQIRYAATYHPAELQRHLLTSDNAQPVTTVRTLQQYWGISHFAAGGTTGVGYFGSAYADWIVPRPVALTENTFSTFLLSEHGWTGGLAVLLCYLAIALALLHGALRTADRAATAPRALLLVGIAAFWIVPALYIAGANGLVLPLTGQNMPMLGLLSRADVALATWLTAIGLCAFPATGSSGIEHVPSAGWVGRLRTGTVATGGVFTVATIALSALLWSPTHAEIGNFSLDGVIADVESLVDQGAIHVANVDVGADSIAIAAAAAAHPFLGTRGFVRSRVSRANSIARGEPAGAGCLDSDALLRARDDGTVAVFNALCGIRAATRSSHAWTGSIVTAAREPVFVLSDGRTAVMLDPSTDAEAILGPCSRSGTVRARTIRIGCAADAPAIRFGTTAPVLESAGSGVALNGVQAEAPTLIRHGDHLRIAQGADAWVHELPRGAVSYARWENAESRRITQPSGATWLAQLDTQMARGMADAERAEWDAEVTLLAPLQAELQTRLAEACAGLDRVRRCSALIADPETGAILAVAASAQQPHRYLPADPNLRNHPAASAIKPILAAAALHAYPQLRSLEIEHAAAEYSVVANTGVQPSLRAPRSYPSLRIPLRGYLGASDNLYSATLGFIATSTRAPDGTPALRGQSNESRLVMNGRPLLGGPSWSGSNGTMDLSESPLAQSLHDLFGVYVRSDTEPAFERTFWQPAVDAGALVSSADLQRITPEPVGLRMDAFRSPRELTSFTIGGDRNRWNNAALVEAMSRIHTGRAVRLHLLRSVGSVTLDYTAGELPAFTARRDVLDGMAAVTQEPWGTAWALRTAFAPHVQWRAKTGTLREREWTGSLLLFVGDGGDGCVAPGAGVVTIEFESGVNPDGAATAVFREAVVPVLRAALGWGDANCLAALADPLE